MGLTFCAKPEGVPDATCRWPPGRDGSERNVGSLLEPGELAQGVAIPYSLSFRQRVVRPMPSASAVREWFQPHRSNV
jgi:hypothetical protein